MVTPGVRRPSVANRIEPATTLGDVVASHPALTRELERGEYQPPADDCASYRACYAAVVDLEADIHLHVDETNVFFPAVVRLQEQRPGVGS